VQYKKPGIERFTIKAGKFRDSFNGNSDSGDALPRIQPLCITASSIAQRGRSVMLGEGWMALARASQTQLPLWRGSLLPLGCAAAAKMAALDFQRLKKAGAASPPSGSKLPRHGYYSVFGKVAQSSARRLFVDEATVNGHPCHRKPRNASSTSKLSSAASWTLFGAWARLPRHYDRSSTRAYFRRPATGSLIDCRNASGS